MDSAGTVETEGSSYTAARLGAIAHRDNTPSVQARGQHGLIAPWPGDLNAAKQHSKSYVWAYLRNGSDRKVGGCPHEQPVRGFGRQ